MATETWTNTSLMRPHRGQRVDWIAPDGRQIDGGTFNGVWNLPGEPSMYVYYTPIMWRPAKESTDGD